MIQQLKTSPDNVLANYFAYYGNGIVKIAGEVKDGSFEPTGNVEFGLADDDVMWLDFVENADIPDDVMQAVEDAKQQIIAGEVDTLAPVE